MYKRLLFLIVVSLPWVTHAQNYLWPTEASRYLTSSFGEYRNRHFHSGIDIKSWNQSGYKVFAVDNGYLWRIRTSNTGYGKVLYQKLDDGRIAVYAHLDCFTEEIDTFVHRLQDDQGSYELDYFPRASEFPVKRGDVIGYTGNTGTRYPHLHFEIRSPQNIPINPLATGFSIQDRVPPSPQALAVTPLSPQARVNGDYFTDILSLRYLGQHTYRTEPVIVSGPFGLEIRAYDGVNDVHNKYSIHSAEVVSGDSVLFSFEYNRFRFTQTNLILLERNFALQRHGLGRFQRLYKTEHTSELPFYHSDLHGQIDLPPGEHTLILILKDFNGNRSMVEVPVISVPSSPHRVRWNYAGNGDIRCQISPADSSLLKTLRVKTVDSNGRQSTYSPNSISMVHDTLRLALPPFSFRRKAYIVQLPSANGQVNHSYPFTSTLSEEPDPTFDWVYSRMGMIATLTLRDPMYKPVYLELISSKNDTLIPFHTQDLRHWNTPPLSPDLLKNAALLVTSNSHILTFFPYDNTLVHPESEAILASKDHTVEVHFKQNSLFYSSLVWYRHYNNPDDENLTPIWSFFPKTIPFQEKAGIRVKVPETSFPRRQIGIYFRNSENHGWHYLPAEFSADSTMLTGEILSLESFTLRRDSLPPVIHILSPRPGNTFDAGYLNKITCSVYDSHSDIAEEEGIQLLLDGQKVIFEHNPITNIVTHRLRSQLAPGTHTVQITARDAAGNTTRQSYSFTIR